VILDCHMYSSISVDSLPIASTNMQSLAAFFESSFSHHFEFCSVWLSYVHFFLSSPSPSTFKSLFLINLTSPVTLLSTRIIVCIYLNCSYRSSSSSSSSIGSQAIDCCTKDFFSRSSPLLPFVSMLCGFIFPCTVAFVKNIHEHV
jgi:hypothetical protein